MGQADQELLNKYFSGTWLRRDRNFDRYRLSGWALVDKVGASESVLDVGCGNNPFKGRLNVFGIDPVNPNADLETTIEEFNSDRLFDVAFCLGSINFGSEDNIRRQIKAVISHLKPVGRVYWRCNPGRHDHQNSEFEAIEVFPWSFGHHVPFAAEVGFRVTELQWDSNNRIYAEWIRG